MSVEYANNYIGAREDLLCGLQYLSRTYFGLSRARDLGLTFSVVLHCMACGPAQAFEFLPGGFWSVAWHAPRTHEPAAAGASIMSTIMVPIFLV